MYKVLEKKTNNHNTMNECRWYYLDIFFYEPHILNKKKINSIYFELNIVSSNGRPVCFKFSTLCTIFLINCQFVILNNYSNFYK